MSHNHSHLALTPNKLATHNIVELVSFYFTIPQLFHPYIVYFTVMQITDMSSGCGNFDQYFHTGSSI